jgi:hypothetical protein
MHYCQSCPDLTPMEPAQEVVPPVVELEVVVPRLTPAGW